MLTRLGLIAAASVAVMVAFAGGADADSRWKFRYYNYDPDYDFYYGPEYVPQPRYYRYFRRDRRAYRYDEGDDDYAYDPDYYEPEYIPPRKKRRVYVQPPIETKPKPQASKPQAKKKATTITCAKAGEIVSGYGFKSVEQVSCKGQVYAFNATRDGKPFSIKLSAASGELTEVKKR
ncbi:MAG: hypothetical protein AB7F74_16215 [Parvibaculaceae bacterium]